MATRFGARLRKAVRRSFNPFSYRKIKNDAYKARALKNHPEWLKVLRARKALAAVNAAGLAMTPAAFVHDYNKNLDQMQQQIQNSSAPLGTSQQQLNDYLKNLPDMTQRDADRYRKAMGLQQVPYTKYLADHIGLDTHNAYFMRAPYYSQFMRQAPEGLFDRRLTQKQLRDSDKVGGVNMGKDNYKPMTFAHQYGHAHNRKHNPQWADGHQQNNASSKRWRWGATALTGLGIAALSVHPLVAAVTLLGAAGAGATSMYKKRRAFKHLLKQQFQASRKGLGMLLRDPKTTNKQSAMYEQAMYRALNTYKNALGLHQDDVKDLQAQIAP